MDRFRDRICNYNVTCENLNCKMYKRVIGRNRFNVSCPICGEMGRSHTQKCKALENREIRCVCNVKREWYGVKGYSDYWLRQNDERKERYKLKENKGKRTNKKI